MRRDVLWGVAVLIVGLVFAVAQKKPGQREQRLPNPGQAASPEMNKNTARRVFDDLLTQGRYGEVNSIYDSNARVSFGNRTESLSQAIDEGRGWRSAAPDLVMTADQITVNGDMVIVNWSARGTHLGTLRGIPPTGKQVTVTGMLMEHYSDGRPRRSWMNWDGLGLMQQLGIVPALA